VLIQLADQRVYSFAVPPGDAATVHIVRGAIEHVVTPPGDFTDPAARQQLATGQSHRFTTGAMLRGEGITELTIEWESHQAPELPPPDPETEPDEED
jgi:hypothetical protein